MPGDGWGEVPPAKADVWIPGDVVREGDKAVPAALGESPVAVGDEEVVPEDMKSKMELKK